MGETPLATFDFTLKFQDERWEDIGTWLNGWCKKWVFQKEVGSGETEYVHWQGRVSLIVKKRFSTLLKQLKNDEMPFHWSITSSETHTSGSFNYVLKNDGRLDGPWTDKDYEEPPKLTWQLQVFMDNHKDDLYPYQKWIMDYLQGEKEMRNIICIVNEGGFTGKSLFAEFLEYQRLAYEIPPFTTSEDIMQCVMNIKEQKAYLIDMPRAMPKERLAGFYAGIEALKDGKCYDKRYAFKKRRMNRPKVIIFTNKFPKLEYLSADRWTLYSVGDNGAFNIR